MKLTINGYFTNYGLILRRIIMKNSKSRLVFTMALVLLIVLALPMLVFAEDGEEYVPKMYGTAISLLPPVIAIALALITKEVYSSLFIGIVSGAVIWAIGGQGFFGILEHVMNDGVVGNLADSYNMGIIVFLVLLGWLVAMMNKTGASQAFGVWAEQRIKTKTGASFATIALGCLIFVDDYFNCLTVGSVMRPVTDAHKISRAKLAYLIDATAAPVCIIAPVSSWAAAVVGFVPDDDGFLRFIKCIPFNYYAILTLLMMVLLVVFKFDYGPMKKHEINAAHGDLYTTADRPYADDQTEAVNGKGKVVDMIVPVVVLIVLCVIFLLYSGGFFEGTGFIDSFSNADAAVGLSLGSMLALIFAVIWYVGRKVLSFHQAMESFPEGFKAMAPAIMILTFAWTLKTMTDSLGAKDFVAAVVDSSKGGMQIFLPAIIFAIAVGLSFATGTSWGTFGILIPIVIPLFSGNDTMISLSMAACMAGAVCGDHCSPISDTTIMASAGAQSNHINHVNTQLPYALTVAVVSFVGYIITGFLPDSIKIAGLLIAIALMVATMLVIKNMFGKGSEEEYA